MKLRVLLARLKRQLLKKPFLKDAQYPPYWFQMVLGAKEASIVQIGSNDGKTGDPLHQLLQMNKNWKALFVEPVPYLYQRLQSNYKDSNRFRFENVAINNGDQLTFYWVNPNAKESLKDLPFWYDQLGSFDQDHIVKQLGDRIKPFILSEVLEGIQLDSLFKRNKIEQLDVLHIDTEGYDWKILSQLNLNKFEPSFILYEMNHLSKQEMNASYQFLKDKYDLFHIGIDILAVSTKVEEQQRLKMSLTMKKYDSEL
ncbi:MAG: FkbM family methyltransferase [Flavobacteriales bacterium]|nr:FkbM family methyltransferase [Flavobacteriales bacterium]